jgi:hypothetical protein
MRAETRAGLHEKYPLLLSDFNQYWNVPTNLRKLPTIKFHENPAGGARVVTFGQTDVQILRS